LPEEIPLIDLELPPEIPEESTEVDETHNQVEIPEDEPELPSLIVEAATEEVAQDATETPEITASQEAVLTEKTPRRLSLHCPFFHEWAGSINAEQHLEQTAIIHSPA
jgi:hypothetical protein